MVSSLQIGVALPHFSQMSERADLVDFAVEAEALGFDAVWTTDHVLMARGQEEPYGRILEALISLTYVAALTQRVKLGTSVIVVPQRQPVLLAKQVATLDALSGGRVILGVGAGWNEREFGFLGANFHDRGRRLDETIRAMRELWTSPDPRFEGSEVRFADVLFAPPPAQVGGPPIWVGGGSQAALRRAATLCEGWQAVGASVETFAEGMRSIRQFANGRQVVGAIRLRTAVGRSLPEQRNASGATQTQLSGSADEIVERIRAYRDAGASDLALFFGADDREQALADMRRFARDVRPRI